MKTRCVWTRLSSTSPVLALMLPGSDAKSSLSVFRWCFWKGVLQHAVFVVSQQDSCPASLIRENKYLSVVGATLGFSVLRVSVLH